MGSGYYKDISGKWKRIPGKRIANCLIGETNKDNNVNEDTKIRRDIHAMLVNMVKENRSSIEIKYILLDKYPNYEEYIVKMINQIFSKMDSINTKQKASREEGDER